MANYTALKFKAHVNEKFREIEHCFTPPILKYMYLFPLFDAGHPFYKNPRADHILSPNNNHGENYGQSGDPILILKDGVLSIHNKHVVNYENVIEEFLDWITPYIDLTTLEGEVKYEEWHHAAPLVVKDNKIVIDTENVFDRNNVMW